MKKSNLLYTHITLVQEIRYLFAYETHDLQNNMIIYTTFMRYWIFALLIVITTQNTF